MIQNAHVSHLRPLLLSSRVLSEFNSKRLIFIRCKQWGKNYSSFWPTLVPRTRKNSVPLFQAMVAAAMSHKVEVIFTGLSAVLAVAGHAENVILNVQQHRTVYDVIQGSTQGRRCFQGV